MSKKLLIFMVGCFSIINVFAQVKDISFTLSPLAEYSWMDNKSGLKDATIIGGKLGFGFGEYVELRALYKESLDLETKFDKFGIVGYNSNLFLPQDIKYTSWGGELKANISRGGLNPYITLGTGVQKIDIDAGEEYEQIFSNVGLGIKTQFTDRIVFTIEGKGTMYNFDAGKYLLSPANKTDFGVTDADFSSELITNWSVQGSLQFYLGGRRPGTLSELDKAYYDKFSGGFKGLQFVFEPSFGYLDFDKESAFRNTYLLGGFMGLDFNKYTGVRLFYFHATKDDELSTDFDRLSMYGAEFRARLNDSDGVSPFLTVGGGYLNTLNGYLGENSEVLDGENFASLGVGVNVPLSKNFLLTGGAKVFVTSSQDIEDLTGPDEIQKHMMYNAGIKFVFGQKSVDPKSVYNRQLDEALTTQKELSDAEYAKKLEKQKMENAEKLAKLKKSYTAKLDSLQKELEIANRTGDVDKAVEVLEMKKETQTALVEVEKVNKKSEEKMQMPSTVVVEKVIVKEVAPQPQPQPEPQVKELIKMSPMELEILIDKILKESEKPKPEKSELIYPVEVESLNKRIDFLEKLILQMNRPTSSVPQDSEMGNIMAELEKIKYQTELNTRKLDAQNLDVARDKPVVVNTVVPKDDGIEKKVKTEVVMPGRFIDNERTSKISDKWTYKGASAFTGFNVGEKTTFNLGARLNYGLPNVPFELVPEFFYGFSDSYGLSANILYPFKAMKYDARMTPYAGFGLGFLHIDSTKLNYNLMLGTYLKFADGRVFVDYTSRNFFKYNQFALGYRFDF